MNSPSSSAQITCLCAGAVLFFAIISQSNCENVTDSPNFKRTLSSSQNLSSFNSSALKDSLEPINKGRPLVSQPPLGGLDNTFSPQQEYTSSITPANITQSVEHYPSKLKGFPTIDSGQRTFSGSSSTNFGAQTSFSTPNSPNTTDLQKWRQRDKSPEKAQPDPNDGKEYAFWPLQVNYYPYKRGFRRVVGIPGRYTGAFDPSTFPYRTGTRYGPLKSFQAQSYVPDLVPSLLKKNRNQHFHTN